MEPMSINYWAVLVAGAVYMILGSIWYSPVLFGKTWTKNIGKTKEQIKADFSPFNLLWAFIGSFIGAYGIARIMLWSGGSTIADGIKISIVVGVCFVMVTMGINDMFEKRPCKLTMINILYHMVSFIIIGIIIGAWH